MKRLLLFIAIGLFACSKEESTEITPTKTKEIQLSSGEGAVWFGSVNKDGFVVSIAKNEAPYTELKRVTGAGNGKSHSEKACTTSTDNMVYPIALPAGEYKCLIDIHSSEGGVRKEEMIIKVSSSQCLWTEIHGFAW